MWSNCTPDSKFIVGIENFNDIFEIEKPKIESIYKDCDVMITHVNPSAKNENVNVRFHIVHQILFLLLMVKNI